MSYIDSQIRELREIAEIYEGMDGGELLKECADTIESLYKKLTEKSNGGWISCSERLPEEERFYIVTYKFDDEENYKCHELYYGVADGENNAGWYIDDDCEKLYKPFTVIAWKPLPEAYHG